MMSLTYKGQVMKEAKEHRCCRESWALPYGSLAFKHALVTTCIVTQRVMQQLHV